MATTDDNTGKLSEPSDIESTTSSDGDGDSDSGEPVQVEWLATTRAKRSTAGNRMKSMLANEEPAADDSDLELLFASDEDDAGFSDDAKEDASDVQMDSSSDDEDREGGDDDDGEKELERQAREKKTAQRKRKAHEAIPAKFRKKVRIEQPRTAADSASPRSTAPPPAARPPPRPKKKSERMSWLPVDADMPTRASERSTTRISKQQLHQKMVKDEVRRKKQMERMEKSAKRLEALKKPPMTQAERLAEAATIEKRNSKSLNRWEVAEKQREEERLRKIAALNNRKLSGPVVTFWSGIQTLEEGQLKHVGNLVSMEEKVPRKKRQSAVAALAAKEQDNSKPDNVSNPASPVEPSEAKIEEVTPCIKSEVSEASGLLAPLPPISKGSPEATSPKEGPAKPAIEEQHGLPTPAQATAIPVQMTAPSLQAPVASIHIPMAPVQPSMAPSPVPPPTETAQTPSAVLAAPVLAPPVGVAAPMLGSRMAMLSFSSSVGKSNCLAPPNTSSHTPSPLSLPPTTPSSGELVTPSQAPPVPIQIPPASTSVPPTTLTPSLPSIPNAIPLQPAQGKATPPPKGPDTPKEAIPETPCEGKVTRSCIILQNFDENAIKDRQVQTQILFGRKMNKLASKLPHLMPHKHTTPGSIDLITKLMPPS